MHLEIAKIARLVSGTLTPANAAGSVIGVSTDSRTIKEGELFVPLVGPNFNGHDYLGLAVKNGAAACLSEEVVAGLAVPVIRVADTLKALGDLASGLRRKFAGPVVAVTGSSGKTTTKEMLASILGRTGEGLKTEGNFNNLIGLPLTLFQLDPVHQWVVLEMGMSARGEIARLAEIAAPSVGVITNVGPAHLQTLQGLDGVARAKGELFEALTPGATAVINADDEKVVNLPVANGVKKLLFGLGPRAEVRAEGIRSLGGLVSFDLILPAGLWPVTLSIPGRHNVSNALAAAAAAFSLGVDGETIARGLEAFRTSHGRMELVGLSNGARLIEDTYNANPLSMKAALVALDEMGGGGRRIAVLGDMLELGDESAALHRQVGKEAASRVDYLMVFGEMARYIAEGAAEAGLDKERITILKDHEEGTRRLAAMLEKADRVLIKGSRGMTMEKITKVLREGSSAQPADKA